MKAQAHVTKLARGWALLVATLAATAFAPAPAQAAFPGVAGPIAYQRIFVLIPAWTAGSSSMARACATTPAA